MPIDNSTRFPKPLAADLRELSEGMAIVIDGDTAPKAIASGQYLFIKNHSTLATGGYHATAAIASGADITSSNVTPDADGIVNGAVSALSDQITPIQIIDTVLSNNGITAYKAGNVVSLTFNFSGGVTANGIQLPESLKPKNLFVTFIGKANVSGTDRWYQGFTIDSNGRLTARSNDNNSAIAVTWAYASVTYIAA